MRARSYLAVGLAAGAGSAGLDVLLNGPEPYEKREAVAQCVPKLGIVNREVSRLPEGCGSLAAAFERKTTETSTYTPDTDSIRGWGRGGEKSTVTRLTFTLPTEQVFAARIRKAQKAEAASSREQAIVTGLVGGLVVPILAGALVNSSRALRKYEEEAPHNTSFGQTPC